MNFHVVTTCNRAGWEQTGRRMAKSFLERWPVPLTIYAEDFEPDVDGLTVRAMPKWLDYFKRSNSTIGARCGMTRNGYDFRFDGVKFSHKVAALTDFAIPIIAGIVTWIDADTFTHSDVSEDWLEGLFPGKGYIAWLDRVNTFPECGFVMYRASHPYHRNFMESFRRTYESGEVFKLKETHDSFVLQHLVQCKMNVGKIEPPVSLSGDNGWHHPFVNGPLGSRLDHMKGPRKTEGRSRPLDLRNPRLEPYWQEPK